MALVLLKALLLPVCMKYLAAKWYSTEQNDNYSYFEPNLLIHMRISCLHKEPKNS